MVASLTGTKPARNAVADLPLVRWASQRLGRLIGQLDHRSMTAGPIAIEFSESAGIEILWDQPQPAAPEPWRPADGGWAWRLACDTNAAMPHAHTPSAIPALVTLGKREDRYLLLDLEAYGAITVAGPKEHVDAFLCAVAIELAGDEDHLTNADVFVFGLEASIDAPDKPPTASTDTAVEALERAAAAVEKSLRSRRRRDTFQARIGATIPIRTTVVVAAGLDTSQTEQLIALCGARQGVALVVDAEESAGAAHIQIDADGVARLSPLGIEFEPAGVANLIESGLDEPLTGPASTPEQSPEIDSRDVIAPIPHDATELAAPSVSDDPVVEERKASEPVPDAVAATDKQPLVVRVLGTPSVPGRPDIGRRETILTAYLACREGPVAASALQDALWGGKPVETKTVWNLIGATRRALGDLDDGRPVLPAADRSRGGTLQLSDGVTTDLAQLRDLVRQAEGASSLTALELLREGLSLVTGPPFDAVGYDWAYRDQDVAEASTVIEQAAEQLTELALEADQVDIAREAVVRGLRGLPGNEELYRCRMRVEHHAGNLAGVTAAYEELVAYLNDLETVPSPATSALFHDLTRPVGRC